MKTKINKLVKYIFLVITFFVYSNYGFSQYDGIYWLLGGHYDDGFSDAGNITSFNKFPNDDKFLTSAGDGTIRIFDLTSYSLIKVIDKDTSEYPKNIRTAVTPDGKYFITEFSSAKLLLVYSLSAYLFTGTDFLKLKKSSVFSPSLEKAPKKISLQRV